MKKIFFSVLFFVILTVSFAQPGKDGPLTVSSPTQVLNKYAPVSTTISVGSNTLSVYSSTLLSLCPGDLIMVYQAQGASIDFTNTVGYGNINAYNSAGLYEFKYVQSISGNVITTQTTFTNAYSATGKTQVIKVPQYTTLTVNAGGGIIPRPWADTTISAVLYRFGGLVVINAINIVNNGTITASSAGFRGGGILLNSNALLGITSYVSSSSADAGEKGESVFGYQPEYDVNSGRYARGGPANGGGGGDAHNSGGGGGANGYNGNTWTGCGVMVVNASNPLTAWALDPDYISNSNALTSSSGGGRGGYSFGSINSNATTVGPNNVAWGGDSRRNVGGLGGRPLTNINSETRIYFGGGGGAGDANNNVTPPGGNGGGIVYLISTGGISGSGIISADGSKGGSTFSCSCDGASGAGGGGSIVIKTAAIVNTQTVSAVGGVGGDQLFIYPLYSNVYASTSDENDGPGGGGGGGFAAISSGAVIPLVSGGANGTSLSTAVTEMNSNGATTGASGQTGTVASTFISYVPTNTISSNSPVCSGFAINFTAPVAASYTWSGPGGFSSFLQNPVRANATTGMSGTYSVTFNLGGSCSALVTQTLAVIVNSSPTLSVINATILCPGASVIISASGASTYTWNPGGIFTNTLAASPSGTTVYTVTGKSAAGCTAVATATISAPPALSLTATANTPSACANSSVVLTATNSGGTPGYTYTWTAGPSTATYMVSQPTGNYVYTVSSRDFNNCLSTKTISLSFINTPTLSVPNVTICTATTGSLIASGAASYTWNTGYVGNTFTAAPAATTVYTVTGTAVNGCSAAASASMTVKAVPQLSFVTASITCASLGSATVTAFNGTGPYSYSWNPTAQTSSVAVNLSPGVYTLSVLDNGTGCTSASTTTFSSLIPFTGTLSSTNSLTCNGANTGTASIALTGGSGNQSYTWSNPAGVQTTSTAAGLSAGIHTVTVTDGLTFCNILQTFQITQPTANTVNISASSATACVGSNIVLSASGIGGQPGYTYTWTAGPATANYTVSQASGGTYSYTVNSKDIANCPSSASIAVAFVAYPVLSVSNLTLCQGTTGTLSAQGASSYTWYPGGYPGQSISLSPATTSTYMVWGNTAGCISTISAQVWVNSLPVPGITSNNHVCEGMAINLVASGSGNYAWVGPNNFTSTAPNPVLIASLSIAGGYSLTVTDGNGCSASTSTVIIVQSNPIPTAIGASVCVGESATLSASGGVGYTWAGPNNYTSNVANAFIPIVDNNTSGLYIVNVTGANGCVSSTVAAVMGYAYPLPTPSINATARACLNQTVSLLGYGGVSYYWQGPNSLVSTSQNLNFTADNLNMAGVYTLTVKNASNCSASTTVSMTLYPLPTASLTTSKNNLCVPFCSTFSLKNNSINTAPIKGFYFSSGPGNVSDSTLSRCFQTAGNLTVQVNYVDTNNCINTSTVLITAYPKPRADFDFSPKDPNAASDLVQFTNLSSSSTPQNEWSWFFDNSQDATTGKDPSHLFEFPGTYPVALLVKNSYGCWDTVVKVITVDEELSLYVPNAFTPNSDGLNDVFQPKGVGIVSYQLDVYDRWGQKLFSSSDFLKGWDGTFKGQPCKTDVYAWKIEVKNEQGKTKQFNGHVSIVYNIN